MTLTAHDGGTFNAYCAMPESGNGRGLLLIQEAFGVTQFMRDAANFYASHGYTVLVPDLYWRIEPGVELTDAEIDRAMGMIGRLDFGLAAADLQATLAALRQMPACQAGVGAIGYCLGGRFAASMAAYGAVDCAIVYYGVRVIEDLEILKTSPTPIGFHYGSADGHCAGEIEPLRAHAERCATASFWLYEGADHAFANPYRPFYDAAATSLAAERTLDLLEKSFVKK